MDQDHAHSEDSGIKSFVVKEAVVELGISTTIAETTKFDVSVNILLHNFQRQTPIIVKLGKSHVLILRQKRTTLAKDCSASCSYLMKLKPCYLIKLFNENEIESCRSR